MKKYQRTQWTEENTKTTVGTILVILCLAGMFFWGMDFRDKDDEGTLNQRQFFVTATGDNPHFAFDNNVDSAWMSKTSSQKNSYNFLVLDFGGKRIMKQVDMLLGGDGTPVNYLITIQSSNNKNIWTDVIGGIETGFFSKKTNFEFPMLTQESRYLRIGIKPFGSSPQKFKVYEIAIN